MTDPEHIQKRVQSPAPFSTWLGIVLLLLVFGAIVVAIIGPAPRGDTYEQQRARDREKKLKESRDEDAKALTTYGWIDKNKGTVRVPIERAMELTVGDLADKKPAPAGPIATPPSAAATGGAAVASPAPSLGPQATGPTSVAVQQSETRGQPAAAAHPPSVQPFTQPGASALPAASPKSSVAVPVASAPPLSFSVPQESRFSVRGESAAPTPTPEWRFRP